MGIYYDSDFVKYLSDHLDNENKVIKYAKNLGEKKYTDFGRERTLILTKVR